MSHLIDKLPTGDIDASEEQYNFRRIDEYWCDIAKIKDKETGKLKFSHLSKLAMCILVLPHGNPDPERGFSINKHMLQIHGSSTKEETLVALRLVKDQLIKMEGILGVPITKELVKSGQGAHKKYEEYLLAKQKEKEENEKRMLEQEAAHKAAQEARNQNEALQIQIDQCQKDLEVLKTGVSGAEAVVTDGNKEMGQYLTGKSIDKQKIILIRSKIDVGVKRKAELESEIKVVERKLAKLEKKK